jgi:hypothetical protein
MSDPFFTFKASIFDTLEKQSPEVFHELAHKFGDVNTYQYLHNASLDELFSKSGLLDEPQMSIPLAKMIHAMSGHPDATREWVDGGGSPLMATQRKSTVLEKLTPILGYRYSMIHSVGLTNFPDVTPEQWRLGVNPAMAASSLLRGFAQGELRVWHFRLEKLPNELMESFNDPSVSVELAKLLSKQPPAELQTGEVFKSPHWFRETLHAFLHFGLTPMVDALCRSPAFERELENPARLMEDLLEMALYGPEPKLSPLVDFFVMHMGIDEHDVRIDRALASRFIYYYTQGRKGLGEFLGNRFLALRDARCIESSGPWFMHVMAPVASTLNFTQSERNGLRTGLGMNPTTIRELMCALHGPENAGIPFLADLLGPKELTDFMGSACLSSLKEDLEKNASKIYYSGTVDPKLLFMDIGTLKGAGALHAILDGLYEAYPKVWGKTMTKLEKATDFDPSDIEFRNQVIELATWVGQALAAEPCSQRAHRWLDRLKFPPVQDIFLRELQPDKLLFQRLDTDMLARKFSSDLGL